MVATEEPLVRPHDCDAFVIAVREVGGIYFTSIFFVDFTFI